jgi:hypothetical protein
MISEDELIAWQRDYMKGIDALANDYHRRIFDAEREYQRDIQRMYEKPPMSVHALVQEYAQMIRASKFWNPLN